MESRKTWTIRPRALPLLAGLIGFLGSPGPALASCPVTLPTTPCLCVTDLPAEYGDTLDPGFDFTPKWKVKNCSATWAADNSTYTFPKLSGNFGPSAVFLESSIPPGGQGVVRPSQQLSAPSSQGNYFVEYGIDGPFGLLNEKLRLEFEVGNPPPPPQCAKQTAEQPGDPFTADPGVPQVKRWTIENCGSQPWKEPLDVVGKGGNLSGVSIAPFGNASPGDTTEIHATFTAPVPPGTYSAAFRLRGPDEEFGGTFDLVVNVPVKDCAILTGAPSIPPGTQVTPGEPLTQAWPLENCGNQDWAGVSAVRSPGGDIGPPSFDVPDVLPLHTGTAVITLNAPTLPQSYDAVYKLTRGGTTFGPDLRLAINVVPPDYCARFVRHEDPFPTPRATEPGVGFVKKWVVRNCGNVAWGDGFTVQKVLGFGPDVLFLPPLFKNAEGVIAALVDDVQVPTAAGHHVALYKAAKPDGERFGDFFPIEIVVPDVPSNDPDRARLVAKLAELRDATKASMDADADAFAEINARYWEAMLFELQLDARALVQFIWDVSNLVDPVDTAFQIPRNVERIMVALRAFGQGPNLGASLAQLAGTLPTDPFLGWETFRDDHFLPFIREEAEILPGVSGTNGVKALLDQKYAETVQQIPDPLPPGYPVEGLISIMDRQIRELEASRQGETWVEECSPNPGGIPSFTCTASPVGVLQVQRESMAWYLERLQMDDEISWYLTLGEMATMGGAIGFKVGAVVTTGGAALAPPVELAIWGGYVAASAVFDALGAGVAVDTLVVRYQASKVSLFSMGQLLNDTRVRQAVFLDAADLVLSKVTSAAHGAGAVSLPGPAVLDVAADLLPVADVQVAEDSATGEGTAFVTLRNDGARVTATVKGNITTWLGGKARIVNLTAPPARTLDPGESVSIPVPLRVFPSALVGGAGYELHAMLLLDAESGEQSRILLPVRHFLAGTPAQLQALSNQKFTTLARAALEPGSVYETTLQFAPGTRHGRILLSFPEGADFDLHLRDAAGRHLGFDYGKGVVEDELPELGLTYQGPGTWPESIDFPSPGPETYSLQVISRNPQRIEAFDVSVHETGTRPALLAVPQAATWWIDHPPGETLPASFALMAAEGGGSEALTALQATMSDLVNDFGEVLAAGSFSVSGPDAVPAGGQAPIRVVTTLATDTPPGVYTGVLTVTASGAGGSPLTAVCQLTVVIAHDNEPPIAKAGGPFGVNEGTVLSVNGSASKDPEGEPLRFRWDLDGGGWDTPLSTDPTAQRSCPDDEVAKIVLQVIDPGNLSGKDQTTLTVRNVAPSVEAGPDVGIPMGASFAGVGSFQDPGAADTHTILWDFGDGATASGTLTPLHPYPTPGIYKVTLTVRDDDGGVGQDALNVEVRPILLGVSDRAVMEGDSGARQAVFRVSLSEPHAVPVSFEFLTVDGTSTAGVDYLPASGAMVLAPGETLREIGVTVLGDEIAGEGDETFTLRLVNVVNAILEDGEGTGTIADDDLPEGDRRFTEESSGVGLALGGRKEGGLAWCDFNGDGSQDALVNTAEDGPGGRSRLYFNDGTGAFVDVTATHARGLGERLGERSAICADLNNDGYLDFARNHHSRIEVYLNRGPAVFPPWSFGDEGQGPNQVISRVADDDDGDDDDDDDDDKEEEINSEGMGFLDFDNDGDLDLVFDHHDKGFEVFANRAERGYVFEHAGHRGLSSQADNGDYLAVADYDGDGFVDVLGRKGTRKRSDLYRNRGGFFKANTSFEERASNGNKGGVAFCDLDADGDFDIAWTDAGRTQVWRNDGGTFVPTGEPSLSAGVSLGEEDIDGVACGDVDNDGDLDLFLSAGSGPSHLFLNESTSHGLKFVRDNLEIDVDGNGEAVAFGDSDRDGDLDLLVNVDGGPNQLWENHLNDSALDHYLEVRALVCLGGGRYRDAVGATIRLFDAVTGSAVSPVQEVNGGSGHGSQSPASVHFGLALGRPAEYVVHVAFPGEDGKAGPVEKIHVVPDDLPGYQLLEVKSCADVNQAPVAHSQAVTVPHDQPLEIRLTGSDPEGRPLSYLLGPALPLQGTLTDLGRGRVRYTPEPGRSGPDILDFSVSDGEAESAPATVRIQVMPPPHQDVGAAAGVDVAGPKPGGAAWCDLNADGFLDLLVNTEDDRPEGRTRLLLSAEAATPGKRVFVDVTATHARGLTERLGHRSVICADVNNDGHLDFARNHHSRIEIYLNKGPGASPPLSFGTQTQAPNQVITKIDAKAINSEGMGFLDYDNDGDLDLVFDNHEKGLELFANRAEQGFVFKYAGHRGLPAVADNGDYLAVADYDGDGFVDVLGRKGAARRTDLSRNHGGLFKATPSFEEQASNGNKGGVAFCDFDGDGDLDVAWTDAGTTQIWRNEAGAFVPTGEPSLSSGVALGQEGIDGVACGDVDNDGDVDFFLSAASGPSHLFLNDTLPGGGAALHFTRIDSGIDVAGDAKAVAFADYDRDGDLDLFASVSEGASQLWESRGNDHGADDYLAVRALRCVGGGRYRDDVGARIRLLDATLSPVGAAAQEVSGGSGRGSQGPAYVHFGLPGGGGQDYVVEVQFIGAGGKTGPNVQVEANPSLDFLAGQYQLLEVRDRPECP